MEYFWSIFQKNQRISKILLTYNSICVILISWKEEKMNNLLKKPIGSLTLAECYQLAKHGYEITKSNNNILVRKSK